MTNGHGSSPAVQRRRPAELRTGGVVPTTLDRFIEFESAAMVIRNFQPLLIPGLLQTAEYARAVLAGMHDDLTEDHVDAMVDVRMRRQELLDRANPPSLHFVLDEAVVRREVAGPAAARRQMGRLIELAARPNVTIELVPFSADPHTGLRGPFIIVEEPLGAADDVLYLERLGGCLISLDMPDQTLAYRRLFERLRGMSLGPAGTLAFLRDIASS